MSEKAPELQRNSPESNGNSLQSREAENRLREAVDANAEKAVHKSAEAARSDVEAKAISGKEMAPSNASENKDPSPTKVTKHTLDIQRDRILTRTRKDLSAPDRQLSKIIHNPVVDSISEAAGKTIARPSSMLGGALFASVGILIFTWIIKHYGYEYNYLIVIALFVFGAAAGLVIEASLKVLKHK